MSSDGARVLTAGADGSPASGTRRRGRKASCRGHTGAVRRRPFSQLRRPWSPPGPTGRSACGRADRPGVGPGRSTRRSFPSAAADRARSFSRPRRSTTGPGFAGRTAATASTAFTPTRLGKPTPGVRGLTTTATRYGSWSAMIASPWGRPRRAGAAVSEPDRRQSAHPRRRRTGDHRGRRSQRRVSADGLVLAVTELVNPGGRRPTADRARGARGSDRGRLDRGRIEGRAARGGRGRVQPGRALAFPIDRGRPVRFISLVPTIPEGWRRPGRRLDGPGLRGKPAYEAVWALVDHGPKAVALIAERLRPAVGPSADEIRKLVEGLDRPKFADREAATRPSGRPVRSWPRPSGRC